MRSHQCFVNRIILSVFGIGFLCWRMFNLTVYALPFFAGMTAGLAAYQSGAGMPGGLIAGFAAAVLPLVGGQTVFATFASPPLKGVIALAFAAPASVAGLPRRPHACPDRRAGRRLARSIRHRRRDCCRSNYGGPNCGHGAPLRLPTLVWFGAK